MRDPDKFFYDLSNFLLTEFVWMYMHLYMLRSLVKLEIHSLEELLFSQGNFSSPKIWGR